MDKSKTSFGLSQVNNETPEWANWIFRGYFIISKALIGYLAALSALHGIKISVDTFTLITVTINLLLDPVVYGFSKLFGVVPDAPNADNKLVADKEIDDKGDTKAVNPVIINPEK